MRILRVRQQEHHQRTLSLTDPVRATQQHAKSHRHLAASSRQRHRLGRGFLAAIDKTIKYFNDGDIVEGRSSRSTGTRFCSTSAYKTEGVIPSRKLSIKHDVDPNEVVSVGDEGGSPRPSAKEDKGRPPDPVQEAPSTERARGTIEALKEKDEAVKGTVIEVVKGGLILDIGLRGFLPASLVEMRRVRDLQPYIGKEIEAKIIELDKNRNNVVLSRRAWLEQTQSEVRSEFLNQLQKGAIRKGVVSSIVNFGAFVDLGGSTAWCTSPSCPGSTSTIRPRWSRWATRSPSRCSTSTWTANACRCR